MQDLTTKTVTDAVLDQMATTKDARLREVMASLVRHMHDFARDVRLTPDEWLTAIGFLTKVGQACTPARQEFILLSDVLGLSALVNLMHDREATELGTTSSLLGPFYRDDAPEVPIGGSIIADQKRAELLLYGRVTDTDGRGIPGAFIQLWQTNSEGCYDLQVDGGANMDMRGNVHCDTEGRFHVRTVRPLGYTIPMDGPVGDLVHRQGRHGCRPAHVHFLIGAPGYRELVTALYFSDDPHIDSDTVFGVSAPLVIAPVASDPDAPVKGMPSVRYDFTLARATGAGSNRVGADPKHILAAE